MSDKITGVPELDFLLHKTVNEIFAKGLRIPPNIKLKPRVVRSIQASLCSFLSEAIDEYERGASGTDHKRDLLRRDQAGRI